MICPNCLYPVPPGVTDARFCVECGYPVSQPCPYEPKGEAVRLALRDESGRSPASCARCGGLLQTCTLCGRLHTLEERSCRTPGCAGNLIEPTEAFPSGRGSLDGRRNAKIRGRFVGVMGEPLMVQDVEELQQIAYRYGLLVGVSRRNLSTYYWNSRQWIRRGVVPLTPAGQETILSLIVVEGYAFVQTADRALAVLLSTLTVEQTFLERGRVQARSEDAWFRVVEGQNGENALLLATDCRTWQSRSVKLPVMASEVTDLVVMAGTIVLTTQSAGLLSISMETGQISAYGAEIGCAWVRAAASQEKVVALGYDANRQALLFGLDVEGTQTGPYPQGAGFLGDFSWTVEETVILTQPNALALLPAYQLSEKPSMTALPSGASVQPGLISLSNTYAERRLLLCQAAQNLYRLQLVEPVTGALTAIGGALSTAPLLCIADTMLVVASREGMTMRLRTYALGQE